MKFIERTNWNILVENVVEWAEQKGIYENSTALSQQLYAIGELTNEFRDAIAKNKSDKEIKTELGDVLVFYINAQKMSHFLAEDSINFRLGEEVKTRIFRDMPSLDDVILGAAKCLACAYSSSAWTLLEEIARRIDSSLEECLELAYNKISKRNGKMQNGKLVKDGD